MILASVCVYFNLPEIWDRKHHCLKYSDVFARQSCFETSVWKLYQKLRDGTIVYQVIFDLNL